MSSTVHQSPESRLHVAKRIHVLGRIGMMPDAKGKFLMGSKWIETEAVDRGRRSGQRLCLSERERERHLEGERLEIFLRKSRRTQLQNRSGLLCFQSLVRFGRP